MTAAISRLRVSWPVWATAGVIALGFALRLRQYVVNRSLWVDEAALALNILNRSFAELAQPLDYWQGASPAFLWLVKAATLIGGESEPRLRLVPLLASLLTLLVFPLVARSYLSRPAALLALLLLAISERLIYYASEVKQYAMDVLVTLLILVLAGYLRQSRLGLGRALLVAIAGIAAVWLSQPAVFVLAGAGLAALLSAWRRGDRRQVAYLVFVGICWLAGFALVYRMAYTGLGGNEQLAQFWAASGFPPSWRAGLGMPAWAYQKLLELFSYPLSLALAGLAALAGIAGVWSFYRRDRYQLACLVLPIGLAFLAAVLRVYPFADRLLLFLAPIIAILLAEGVEVLARSLSAQHGFLGVALAAFLLFAPLLNAGRLLVEPNYEEELRPVLGYVDQQWQAGDRLYVYYGAELAFDYYQRRFHFPEDAATVGARSRENWTPYFDEMDALAAQGGRIWLLFSHVHAGNGASEEALLVNYLNRVAEPHVDLFNAPGAAAYLYDLPARSD